jgi:DNA-binding NarL/FixJ family response regulator
MRELTPRQRQVLRGIRRGLSNEQIATELESSIHTIRAHVATIFVLLGVTNRTQAAVHPAATEKPKEN